MVATDAVTGAPVAGAERVGFLLRFVATIVDAIILGIVGFVLGMVLDPATSGILNFVIGIAYYLYFWTSTGQTIGHKLLNLRVVKTDGSPLTVGNALLRYVGWIVSAIPFGLGFLWVIWDANKQGWHDKIASTYVVRA
jgi:uncharacterized RDD family membrane protein YckC